MPFQKKGDKPTFKQKLFVSKYIQHKGNGAKAALEVYDTDKDHAKTIAWDNLHKEVVKDELTKQLNEAGLGMDILHTYSSALIQDNMAGKPSQAVAADMVKFMYKMHNAVPATKKMSMHVSVKGELEKKSYDEVKASLNTQIERSNKLIASLKKR